MRLPHEGPAASYRQSSISLGLRIGQAAWLPNTPPNARRVVFAIRTKRKAAADGAAADTGASRPSRLSSFLFTEEHAARILRVDIHTPIAVSASSSVDTASFCPFLPITKLRF